MRPAKALVGKAYADGGVTLRARADAALQALKRQADTAPLDAGRLGAFGYCFGGSVALELARSGSDLAGVATLHGGLETYLPTADNKVLASILVLNGADDASVTDAHIAAFEKEMDAAGADRQFVDFSGAVHCFTDRSKQVPAPNCAYDERTTKRAYEMLHDFFRERFATHPCQEHRAHGVPLQDQCSCRSEPCARKPGRLEPQSSASRVCKNPLMVAVDA